jgi:hypothetical protein
VTRHPPGDGVNRVLDVDASLFQVRRELADSVLRFGHRETIARNDDDAARVCESNCGILCSRLLHGPRNHKLVSRRIDRAGTERAEQNIADGAIHGRAHEQSEQRA